MSIYQKIQIHLPLWGLLRKVPRAVDDKQVLILCDDALGDLLMMSGPLKYLCEKGYFTTLVVRHTWQDIAQHLGAQRIIAVNSRTYRQSMRYRISILNQIRQVHYAWAAASLLPSTINADLLRYCGAEQRYMLKWGNSWLERRRHFSANRHITALGFKESPHIHRDILSMLADYYSAILGNQITAEQIKPVLTIKQDPSYPVMCPQGKYLLYISDTMDTIRQYPTEKIFPVLQKQAQKHNIPIVVTGREENAAFAPSEGIINLTGKTSLEELWQIIFHAFVVVGNETGSTHLAWILGKPTLMIYGGGHYGLFRPNDKCHLVCQLKSCFGCSWDTCSYWKQGKVVPCIMDITPAQLETTLEQMLCGNPPQPVCFTEEAFC